VEPILQRVCQRCHVSGGIAPLSLTTYSEAKVVSGELVRQTQARTMPPWGAQTTSECSPPLRWKDDLRLSDEEISTIAAWHDGGDVEGDPAAAPPAAHAGSPSSVSSLAGGRSLAPDAPFDLEGTQDSFQCFVLDPKLSVQSYLNGIFFVPGNRTIVHHALAFVIPATAKVPGETAATPVSRYECFGGPLVDGATLAGAWAPGSVPTEYPPNVGQPLQPGQRFVVQVHYHPHANATKEPDRTVLQIRMGTTVPDWLAQSFLIGNFDKAVAPLAGLPVFAGLLPGPDDPPSGVVFEIPAGAVGHTETMSVHVPVFFPDLRLQSIGAHMHLAGRDEKITLKSGTDQKEQCLLQEPAWNFDWQRGYTYDAPIEQLPIIRGGDTVEIRCSYDNTLQNPKLAAALEEANITLPRPIHLGETTTDEMCLGAFLLLQKN
jgi:hypothetical protein